MFSTFAFWCIVGFVIGGIPFGYLAGLIVLKDDIRKYGSGNIGATNTWRTLGWKCGVIVLILDALKGLLPTLLSAQFIAEGFDTAKIEPLQVATGLCAIAGHMFPIWLSFRGGKGVATALGVVLVLAPIASAAAFGIFLVSLGLWKMVSLSSILSAVTFSAVYFVLRRGSELGGSSLPMTLFAIVVPALIVWRHRSNIARIVQGTERKISGNKVAEERKQEP
jgi:glycerol-3-phosphate acyltransferase PlsY